MKKLYKTYKINSIDYRISTCKDAHYSELLDLAIFSYNCLYYYTYSLIGYNLYSTIGDPNDIPKIAGNINLYK